MKPLLQFMKERMSSLDFAKFHKIFMATFAVVAFIITTTLNQQSVSQAELPHLKSLAVMDSARERSGLILQNKGLGPLVIKDIQIRNKQGTVISNDSLSISTEFDAIIADKFYVTTLQEGEALHEHKDHWFLESKNNSRVESKMIREFLYNASISICYCTADNKNCKTKHIGLKANKPKPSLCF